VNSQVVTGTLFKAPVCPPSRMLPSCPAPSEYAKKGLSSPPESTFRHGATPHWVVRGFLSVNVLIKDLLT